MSLIRWPEIEAFHQVRRELDHYPELLGGRKVVRYRGKVKLHGTNAAVQVKSNNVIPQSRENILGTGNDNAGFAAWVATVKDEFLKRCDDYVIFGEWCGPGIMKGVAITKIPNKIFAVFAAQPLDKLEELIVDPYELLPLVDGIPNVHVIPWIGEDIEVAWLDTPDLLVPVTEEINRRVAKIDECDPWVREVFDIDGPGEGIVFYPVSHKGRKHFSDLAFKSKGDKHKIVGKTKPAQVDPTVASGAKMFAEMFVTEPRCEQGARAIASGELVFDQKKIGEFLKWMNLDVAKECQAELEASKLDPKLVGKMIQIRAREWYIAQTRKL